MIPGTPSDDARWMGAALALAERGVGRTGLNPAVGCVLVKDGRVVGRGWTQPGGRPHAEAVALDAAGEEARGVTAYVTLEPCAHASPRGPACTDRLTQAGVARVVVGLRDPDGRTDGRGFERLHDAGITATVGVREAEAGCSLAPFLVRQRFVRPFVTLKLALSLDGRIATADGESRWITGERARAHGHLERARHAAILVGGGTLRADAPSLDVRLEGLEDRSPARLVLTRGDAPDGWTAVRDPMALPDLPSILVEGGAGAAAAFLRADRVDRLLLYRAPLLIGGGRGGVDDIGLDSLAEAHGRWTLADRRTLGADTLEVYERRRGDEAPCSPA